MIRQLLILVVFSYIAVSVMGTENVLLTRKNGEKCQCKDLSCDDKVTVSQHNTICWKNGLEVLRNRKNARYNKQWIVDLKKMFTVRSYNLEKCDGRCYIKSDSSKCIREANDRFICSWTALLQDIRKEGTKEAVQSILDELNELTARCINTDCKSPDSGPDGCNPQFKDVEKSCVSGVYSKLIRSLKNNRLVSILKLLQSNAENTLDQIAICKKTSTCAQTKQACIDRVVDDGKNDNDILEKELIDVGGTSTGNSVILGIHQGLVNCNLQHK